jgi:Fe-S-cluster containining protein
MASRLYLAAAPAGRQPDMSKSHPARASARQAVLDTIGPDLARRDAEGARRRAQSRLEIELKTVSRESAYTPACTRGCAMCCHLRVAAMPVEVLGVAQYLRRQLDADALAARIERIRETAREVSALPRERLLSVNIPCPLLEADGACGIYPARPLNCRAYHSLDVDACRASFEDPGNLSAPHPQSGWISAVNGGAQEGLREGLRTMGADTTQYELVTALVEALDDPECGARHASGEATFRNAIRL